ncbi:MAG: CC0125/CC1285 family lipoprotein, partial [Caulobacteraceae bacterium]
MKITTAAIVAASAVAGLLTACETATPYQPLEKGAAVSGGFTDQRLDADHFRVTFQGNTLTS